MAGNLMINTRVHINAPVGKTWNAITDPEMIKGFLFGTKATSDWKKGSQITYTGQWQGKTYEDKGVIIELEPEKLLHTTYFSSMSGKEDRPENYVNVIYKLRAVDAYSTEVTIEQDGIENERSAEHLRQNWSMVLDNLKRLLDK